MAGIGIIGTGWGARVQAPTFREAGLSVVAIAGHNAERTQAIADDLGLRAHGDWREILAAPDVDLVSIVTPPSEHLEMALAALEAGKHVLLEKPTAMNAAEAQKLVEVAERYPELVTLIDHELRFLPCWREARERMADEIGNIRYAEVRYSSPARGDRTREWNWWSDAERGGGVWGAVGSHFSDALRYFGLEPESALALTHSTIEERPYGDAMRKVTADDFMSVNLRLRGGAVAAMTFSAVSAGPDESSMLIIHGERGAMRFIGEEVQLSKNRVPYATMAGGPMSERPGNSQGGAFGSGTLHLGRALRAALDEGNREALSPAATFVDGLMQQRVLDAARKSASEGCWATV
ncbi:MAG TPA: Gfo/Idh/MocA family oxidoreductase [Thermoanaerobaculia bacterium]|jgi:predicted dehydrogenase|nr:Gfo/Idh/MocA family oxidoreductase [Thermoanaerobaculia bacterium]